MEHRILLVEDDQIHREMLSEVLSENRFAVTDAASGQQAAEALSGSSFEVALVDICLPDVDGFALLDMLLSRQPECTVLLMTGQATVESAVEAMKRGAYDYLAKPFRMELLLMKLERLFHLKELEWENHILRANPSSGGIVGISSGMRQFLGTVSNVASTGATVLIQGESGTGKELIADLLHSRSPRKSGPMVKVNCGAIPESLMEAELFGYEKGAFTGAERTHRGHLEQAHDGTLFLDEIGEISHAVQVRMLRVLQDKKIQRLGSEEQLRADFRLVAATHRELSELRDAGTIREDFFYRLNVIPLTVPPLRERREDIPLLIDHFIRRYALLYEKDPIHFAPETLEILDQYPFPGNIRELENLVERLQVLLPGTEISPRHLPPECRKTTESGSELIQCFRTELPLREAVRDFETRFIQRVLEEESNNQSAAARRLDISRKNLWEKLSR